MGETIPLIEKGTILETKMEESSSLKTQIESPTENVIETGKEQLLRDRVLADVNILKEIPKDLLPKSEFIKEIASEMIGDRKSVV